MNIKRYVAPTTREAFALVRAELGDDAIVLKNRPVPEGVEILAMAEESVPAEPASVEALASRPGRARPAASPRAPRAGHWAQASGEDDQGDRNDEGDQGDDAMSTVNFEAYVRERRRRRQEQAAEEVASAPRARLGDVPADDAMTLAAALAQRPGRDGLASLARADRSPAGAGGRLSGSPDVDLPASRRFDETGVAASPRARSLQSGRDSGAPARDIGAVSPAAPLALGNPRELPSQADTGALMAELREMRGFLSDRLESVSWFEGVRRRPAQARMLRLLLKAGFSAALSRKLADHLPADFSDAEADQWLRAALRRNLRVDTPGQTLFDAGGVFALLGPTGVGKTTTTAKIAAQFALKHGAESVGLVTADVYRIGAQDQLRTFGRLLGVPVHVAHDVVTLSDILRLFADKKLVLIDTAGVSQRDKRVQDLLAALSSTEVRKVVVLNAAVQAEAIEEVIEAYEAERSAGVVLSKIDEAVQLGGVLDCVIRHRLALQGVANGQRVPEDWHRPDAEALVERAMAAATAVRPTPFCFDEAEFAALLTAEAGGSREAQAGRAAAARVRNV
ncbi:MAG: flagellar biosynthesis protein FlhF [Gammaproteobacteria bacterium]